MKKKIGRLLAVTVCCGLSTVATTGFATETTETTKFSWFANAADTSNDAEALAKARDAIQRARALNVNATWVCSPAGFGQKSRCTRG